MDAIYTTLGIPFGYVLRFIFEAVDNYGLALILFTPVSYTHLTLPTKA